MKKIYLAFIMLLLVVSFLGCNPEETTATTSTSETTTQLQTSTTTDAKNNLDYTISDFTDQFLDCKEHIDKLYHRWFFEDKLYAWHCP